MKAKFDSNPVLRCALALASAAFFVRSASGEESPYATGGEVTVLRSEYSTSYIHVFKNTDEAAEFASKGLCDLKVRYLVVGAGGGGGCAYGSTGTSAWSGGGGGGGGVCDVRDVPFGKGAKWSIRVGVGAKMVVSTSDPGTVAGASSISNGTEEVALVPGGGNGARGSTSETSAVPATNGAGGGGGAGPGELATVPGAGTYASSLFGVVPAGAPFSGGDYKTSTCSGTGGGGAGEAGISGVRYERAGNGGEGLISDITGEKLVYGSGGGGGAQCTSARISVGGKGGTRAGNGATYETIDGETVYRSATAPAANSGGGGGGGGTGVTDQEAFTTASDGADGIVIIRYDFYESPCEGGDVVTRRVNGLITTWIHQFTSTHALAEFVNKSGHDLKVRYLVVGGGGSGGTYVPPGVIYGGGGGGGGGGVCEKRDILFANDSSWQISIGKGAVTAASGVQPEEPVTGGTTTIFDGGVAVETVLGGGCGACNKSSGTRTAPYYKGQDGASGGGGNVGWQKADGRGLGTYTNSIFGVMYGPFNGGSNSATAPGMGGGGAGAHSTSKNGGAGLVSDITGELLVYGSGGGGGFGRHNSTLVLTSGGTGGTRAGNGATFEIVTTGDGKVTNYIEAVAAEANSGGGGGGGGRDQVIGRTFLPSSGADGIVVISYDIYESPCAGGDFVTKKVDGLATTWIHHFTNSTRSLEFVNLAGHDLDVRYLVVGAGGAGGNRYTGSCYAGGGGGGGGVCEKCDVPFVNGSTWKIFVGKGAAKWAETAGASAISNGVEDVETVPGGGNGALPVKANSSVVYYATTGASGGGGSATSTSKEIYNKGAAGTYASSIFGVVPAGAPFAGGSIGSTRSAGGGGGASTAGHGAAGTDGIKDSGGEGLVSDITGEPLVYGSGGGGGAGGNEGSHIFYQGGLGGTRAGNGGYYGDEDGNYTTKPPPEGTPNEVAAALGVAATDAEPNSGGGGGGAMGQGTAPGYYGKGADGIVVISYKTYDSPCWGGDRVTCTLLPASGTRYIYRHFFTCTKAGYSDRFINKADRNFDLRYLVVGGGGSGGNGSTTTGGGQYTLSGGGGGGGGVCEVKDMPFGKDAAWLVRVGAGAKKVVSQANPGTMARASSISNGMEEVVLVPGGGNGAYSDTAKHTVNATDGAAGGGGTTYATTPGAGTYASSIFGVSPEGAPFGGGKGDKYTGGGGGGAAAGGTICTTSRAGDGGEGLSSDITGEKLVYGSGGGGGAHTYYNRVGGLGGTRAGNGATYETTADGTIFHPATAPAANSGCGGAGGMQDGNCNVATDGADGIVVIRYIYDTAPPGLVIQIK